MFISLVQSLFTYLVISIFTYLFIFFYVFLYSFILLHKLICTNIHTPIFQYSKSPIDLPTHHRPSTPQTPSTTSTLVSPKAFTKRWRTSLGVGTPGPWETPLSDDFMGNSGKRLGKNLVENCGGILLFLLQSLRFIGIVPTLGLY